MSAKITAAEVQQLKNATGAGLMDCKRALVETAGDVEAAKKLLQKKGLLVALRKADREVKEGQIFVNYLPNGKKLSYLRLACETDFVARNKQFQQLGSSLLHELDNMGREVFLEQISDSGSLRPKILQAIQALGENILVLECDCLNSDEEFYGYYLHSNKKLLAALVIKDPAQQSDKLVSLLKDLSMHIAANQVEGLTESDLPEKMLLEQTELYREQEAKKPPELREKIVTGKLAKFKREVTFSLQPYLKDPDLTVAKFIAAKQRELDIKLDFLKYLKVYCWFVMFSFIRKPAGTWFTRIVFFVVVLVFAFFGVYSYLSNNIGGDAIRVGNDSVSIVELDFAYRNALSQDAANRARPAELRQRVVENLVNRRLLIQFANELNLFPPDAEIARQLIATPDFHTDGRFDKRKYDQFLLFSGQSAADYERNLSESIALSALYSLIDNLVVTTDDEVRELYRSISQTVDVELLFFTSDLFAQDAVVDDADLQEYLAPRRDAYKTRLTFGLDYFLVDVEKSIFPEQPPFTNAELLDYYRENQTQFSQNGGFDVSHILIAVDEQFDAQAAIDEAIELRLELSENPDDFSALALEHSDDPTASFNNGDLGFLEYGVLDADFEAGVDQLQVGEISNPVLTRFGYHLIRLNERREAGIAPFSEVKDDIEQLLIAARNQANLAKVAEEWGDKFDAATFTQLKDENSITTLNEVEFVGDAVQSINNPTEFFSQLTSQNENDAGLSIQGDNLLVYLIKEIKFPADPDFADIKQRLRADYLQNLGAEKMNADLQALQTEVNFAAPLRQLAEDLGSRIEDSTVLSQSPFIPGIGANHELHETILALDQFVPAAIQVSNDGRNAYGVILKDEQANSATVPAPEDLAALGDSLAQNMQNYYYLKILNAMREKTKIIYNDQLIDAVFLGGQPPQAVN